MGVLLLPMGVLILLAPFLKAFEIIKPFLYRMLEITYGVEIDENGNIIES